MKINRSLIGIVKHVFYDDPALDKEDPGYSFEKYLETGDFAHIPSKGVLTVFHLKPLSMKRLQRITSMRAIDGSWSTEQFGECVAYGLQAVDNMEVDGKMVELEFEEVNGERRVKTKSLQKIFNQVLFMNLGGRVMEISDLNF